MSRPWWLAWLPICAASLVLLAFVQPCFAQRRGLARRGRSLRSRRVAGCAIGNARLKGSSPDDWKPPVEPPALAPRFAAGEAWERIRQAVYKPIRVEFQDTPLDFAAASLADSCGVQVLIHARALETIGIRPDAPVSVRASKTPLRSVLRLTLRQLDLTYAVADEALWITTPEEAQKHLTVGIYPVGDLVLARDRNDELWDDYDTLIETITSTVSQDSWEDMGGPASIEGATLGEAKVLVISQTFEAHEEIRELLRGLRDVAASTAGDGQPPRKDRPPPVVGYACP